MSHYRHFLTLFQEVPESKMVETTECFHLAGAKNDSDMHLPEASLALHMVGESGGGAGTVR